MEENIVLTPSVPILCMNRDKEAIRFALERLRSSEPSSIIGLAGSGKDIIFSSLVETLQNQPSHYKLIAKHCTSVEDLHALLNEIEQVTAFIICIINFSLQEDASWFIEKLNEIREKRETQFVSIIISYIKPVLISLQQKSKILLRSTYILTPITQEDADFLLRDFQRRFTYKPSEEEKKEIYFWSTGYVGLFKSLYLTAKDNNFKKFDEEFLIKQEPVLVRLQNIFDDVSEEQFRNVLQKRLSEQDGFFLQKIGLIDESCEIYNKLLRHFILDKVHLSHNDLSLLLTEKESQIFAYFKQHENILVKRSSIAEVIWNDSIEEHYSDWAIDQFIHKIREKMVKTANPFKIITKKGQGFIFVAT